MRSEALTERNMMRELSNIWTFSQSTTFVCCFWVHVYTLQINNWNPSSSDQFSSLSSVWFFAIPWTAEQQASLSVANFWSSLKLMSIESVMPSNCLVRCHPLLLPPSIFPSISAFSSESALRTRYYILRQSISFNFSITPSNGCSGLISFRMHWFYLLAVQGTLESILQHHSSKGNRTQYNFSFG